MRTLGLFLFGQREMSEKDEDGKAGRGRRGALVRLGAVGVALTTFLLFLSQVATAQSTFSPTGSMGTTRGGDQEFTLTRLCDGRVLAAGGSDGVGNLASAELYDPASGTWTPTGSMITARNGHSATLLQNCQVLVAGGQGAVNMPVSSAELYDPASGTWSTTGSLSTGRGLATAVLLNNGKVLVAAGIFPVPGSVGLASAELYDPASGTWSPTGSLNTARYFQEGILLSDGRVLIAGGMPQGVTVDNFASAEVYDPASGTWSNTGSMAIGRRCCFTLTLLPNGKVLVTGGITDWTAPATALAELYDPATGVWTPTTPLPAPRNLHSATPLLDGTVLVAGGSGDRHQNCVNTALIYNPVAQTWSPTAGTMGDVRHYHRDARLLDGRVLVVGGNNCAVTLATAELFGPTNQAPVANTGADQVVEATSPAGASVTLDGSGSSDPDGDTLSYEWRDAGNNVVGTSASVTLTVPLGSHTFTLTVDDGKGGSHSDTVGITVQDTIPPVLVGSRAPGPNAQGWNNSDVTVTFTCTDSGSGVTSPPVSPQVVNGEGAGQSASATCTDAAGNFIGVSVTDINIDKTPPLVTITTPPNGATYALNAVVAANYACTDGLAGIASCAGPVAHGAGIDRGDFKEIGSCRQRCRQARISAANAIGVKGERGSCRLQCVQTAVEC